MPRSREPTAIRQAGKGNHYHRPAQLSVLMYSRNLPRYLSRLGRYLPGCPGTYLCTYLCRYYHMTGWPEFALPFWLLASEHADVVFRWVTIRHLYLICLLPIAYLTHSQLRTLNPLFLCDPERVMQGPDFVHTTVRLITWIGCQDQFFSTSLYTYCVGSTWCLFLCYVY